MEKKPYNAYEGLKGYDPTSDKEAMRMYKPILVGNNGYSDEEWEEYRQAKTNCESWQEWAKTRSPKHEKMAKEFANRCEELEGKIHMGQI